VQHHNSKECKMSDTEQDILSNIPDLQDTSSDTNVSSGAPEGQGAADLANAPGVDRGSEGRSSAQPTSGSQQSGQQSQRRRRDGLVEQTDPETGRKILVDPTTGEVVANPGLQQRLYETSQRVERENQSLKTRIAGLENALRQSNEVIQEAARLGVAPQDQMIAVRVMSDFMKDPVRTLQALVEEVKSKGYPIPFLNEGVSQGMDMNALSRMIDAKLQPMLQREQAVQHQQQARQQANRDLEAFLEENQEANANLDVLSEMLQAQPGLPLPSAYTKMIRWAHENGLDWTQPLKPQIVALRQQAAVPHQQETRPLPGRSVNRQTAQRMNGAASGQQFSESASWADIIRSAMEEASSGR
jgi:hypothetical protein